MQKSIIQRRAHGATRCLRCPVRASSQWHPAIRAANPYRGTAHRVASERRPGRSGDGLSCLRRDIDLFLEGSREPQLQRHGSRVGDRQTFHNRFERWRGHLQGIAADRNVGDSERTIPSLDRGDRRAKLIEQRHLCLADWRVVRPTRVPTIVPCWSCASADAVSELRKRMTPAASRNVVARDIPAGGVRFTLFIIRPPRKIRNRTRIVLP